MPSYILKEGYVWNPIQSYPRNFDCWCGSTVRAKNCCLPRTSRVCTVEQAGRFKQFVEGVKSGKITREQLLRERLDRDQVKAGVPQA